MTSPASWHALQSFSVVLGSPVRIAAKQLYIYIDVGSTREQNQSQETQKVERISISSI